MKQSTPLGLVLSGGGIKSYSQFPVIEWLKQRQVKIDALAGTSMGSVVAALVACGLTSDQLYQELLAIESKVKDNRMIRPSLRAFNPFGDKIHGGLTDAEPFEDMLEQVFRKYGVVKITDVKIPIAINAVDILTGRMIVFVSHPEKFHLDHSRWYIESDITLAKAVRCSSSYPLVFAACPYKEYACIDGGVLMNVPVPLVKGYGVQRVLAMTAVEDLSAPMPNSLISTAYRVTQIMGRENEVANLAAADLVLNVPLSEDVIFKLGGGKEVIDNARELLADMVVEIDEKIINSPLEESWFERLRRRNRK